jgi:hypothetical protein
MNIAHILAKISKAQRQADEASDYFLGACIVWPEDCLGEEELAFYRRWQAATYDPDHNA